MKRLKQAIKTNNFDNVYVVYGTDHYLYQEVKKLFLNDCLPQEDLEMNVSVFSLTDTTLENAIEEANSFPFFGEKKVVFIENALFLTGEKSKFTPEELQKLEEYINAPNASTILVLCVTHENLDKRKKIVKLLQQKAQVIDVNPLSQDGIISYVKQYLLEKNYQIEADTLLELLTRTQADLGVMVQASDKLMLQVSPRQIITKDDVCVGVVPSLESNLFALNDSLLNKDVTRAVSVYRDLVLQKEEPIMLLAILNSQFRLMYHIHLLKMQGYQDGDIAKYLKQHPYRVQMASKYASCYSGDTLRCIIQILIETDYQLKSSVMDKDVLFELMLMKITEVG